MIVLFCSLIHQEARWSPWFPLYPIKVQSYRVPRQPAPQGWAMGQPQHPMRTAPSLVSANRIQRTRIPPLIQVQRRQATSRGGEADPPSDSYARNTRSTCRPASEQLLHIHSVLGLMLSISHLRQSLLFSTEIKQPYCFSARSRSLSGSLHWRL